VESLRAAVAEWLDPAVFGPYVLILLGKIAAAIAIFVVGRWVAARIAGAVALATEKASLDPTLTKFLRSVVYLALLVMVIMTALYPLGVELTAFLAVLGAAGLAVGLALKDSLANFSSGIFLVFFRPFKVGDYVEAAGVAGTIDSINMFSTTFKTVDNRVVIVPNGMIYAGTITNFTALAMRRIDLVISVDYSDNIPKAKEILQAVVEADERVLKDPAPTVLLLDLAASSVNFAVRPWVATDDYWVVRGDLLERIKVELEKNGLSIPFPQHFVHLVNKP
jgi:small conductance mechanosensitive channel